MKIASIDCGTNSFHLMIGQISAQGQVEVVDRQKDMVRLGDSTFQNGVISPESFLRATDALRTFRKLCDSHQVDATVAVATSATREALNGGDFVRAVRDETGIDLQVISGEEEARLIYLGARSVLPLGNRRALLFDIGGGSVEIMVCDARELYFQRSLKLGVLRLLQMFSREQPSVDERAQLAEFCHRALEKIAAPIQRIGFDFVAISSGTGRALAEICTPLVPRSDAPSSKDKAERSKVVRFSDIFALEQRLFAMTPAERQKMPGLDPRRADSILPGVVLVRSLLEVFHADEYVLCEAGLREGLIFDYAQKHRPDIQLSDEFPDLRRRSVVSLMRRCQVREPHAKQVARLALDIFRGLRPLHGLANYDGELLEFAALLHDAGFYIAASKHHKHGQYLIENVGLSGFSSEEIKILSHCVRYHRKSTPKDTHESFVALSEPLRRKVRLLSSILRVADGLDRTNRQVIESVRCRTQSKEIELTIAVPEGTDLELELWSTRRKADLIEEVFRRKLRFGIVPTQKGTSEEDATTAREDFWQTAQAHPRENAS
ncbi:MAG: Ppx/GppA phosphatase family protein [Polyangia bacterium]